MNDGKKMRESITDRISVLMPAYNEGRHIYRNIRDTERVLRGLSADYEIVVVDDGSRDDTLAEIRRAARDTDGVRYFSYPERQGKGWALRRAFSLSSGETVFFLDSDLDISPDQFEALLAVRDRTDADVVIGSKRHPRSTLRYPLPRRIMSGVYFLLVRLLFGLPLRDTQTGIKLFKREVLEAVLPRILVKKYAFDLEILVNAYHRGFRIGEAPVVVEYRGRFGFVSPATVWRILLDTLAVFYRSRILRYYDRPLNVCADTPLVSILIAFTEPTPYLEECLDAIGTMEYGNYEVILLPDEAMESGAERVKVVPTGPLPPPLKRDAGVPHAKGEIIAFIDDDAYPQEDWLANGVRRFSDDSIAAVGGPASTPPTDDFRQRAGGRVLCCWMVGGVHAYRFIPKMLKEVDDYPTSNLMVSRSAFEAVGGFGVPYWPGEDTVLCLKLTKQLGKKIVYDPDVQVWHHRRPLFRAHLAQIGRYGAQRGRFARLYPGTSFRLCYFLPSLWTLFLLAGWLPLSFFAGGLKLYAGTVLLYLLAACLTGAGSLNIKTAAVVAAGIVSTHVVYGVHFIRGLFLKK